MVPGHDQALSPQVLLAAGIHWLGFVALAVLLGGLAVDVVVLPRAMPLVDGARRGLRRLAVPCLAVLGASPAGDLLLRADAMADGGWPAVDAALAAVLMHTHFGTVWIARGALLAVALVLAVGQSRARRAGALGAAVAIALTTTLTGHAADQGDLTLGAGLDWVHVVATTTWT